MQSYQASLYGYSDNGTIVENSQITNKNTNTKSYLYHA